MAAQEGNGLMFSQFLDRMKADGLPGVCQTQGSTDLMEAEGTMSLWGALAAGHSASIDVCPRTA